MHEIIWLVGKMCLTLWYNLTVKHFQHMQLVTLSGTIFCGAAWRTQTIKIIADTKEVCLNCFLNECSAIHLNWSTTKMAYHQLMYYVEDWLNNHSDCQDGKVTDFRIFSENPEKFIDLEWGDVELPIVTIS